MPKRTSDATPLTINRSTLHSQLANSLREMIVETRIAPGGRVDEKALSESFGVSRTPLREALRVLASEGLVELLPNRSSRATRITRQGVEEKIQQQMLRHYDAGERIEYFRLNSEFHAGIIDIADNSVLSTVYTGLLAQAQRARYVAIQSQDHWDRGVEEHTQILAALARRDSEAAGRLLFEHVRETGQRVGQSLAID